MLPNLRHLSLAASIWLAGAAAAPAGATDLDDDIKFGRNYHPHRYVTENDRSSFYRDDRDDGRWRHGAWRQSRGGEENFGRCDRIEARASYASDYLPYYVKEWRAKESAIDIWREKVARLYGERFAHWRAAFDKRVSCDAGAGSVYCSVSARPMEGNPWWGRYGESRRASYGEER